MPTILRTELFDSWLKRLKDSKAKARIIERIRSAEHGNFGDCKVVGKGVSKMRIHYGQGYRVYFTRTQDVVYVLLCAGTKRGQKRDITKAESLARNLKNK